MQTNINQEKWGEKRISLNGCHLFISSPILEDLAHQFSPLKKQNNENYHDNLQNSPPFSKDVLSRKLTYPTKQEKETHRLKYALSGGYRYQKWPYLKGTTFSKPSFWVSMLVFRGCISYWKFSVEFPHYFGTTFQVSSCR